MNDVEILKLANEKNNQHKENVELLVCDKAHMVITCWIRSQTVVCKFQITYCAVWILRHTTRS